MQETRDYVVKVTGYRKEFVAGAVPSAAPASVPSSAPSATPPVKRPG
jgi:hypothetical protein